MKFGPDFHFNTGGREEQPEFPDIFQQRNFPIFSQRGETGIAPAGPTSWQTKAGFLSLG